MEKSNSNSTNPRLSLKYRRQKNAEEMKHQVITFIMMIFFTFIAFIAVWLEFSTWYIKPVILLLAVVQVIFQLYYFMHMKHKGHETIALFLYSGLLVGLLTVLTFVTIVWI
jgi:cytochrome c oxidase subunit IV